MLKKSSILHTGPHRGESLVKKRKRRKMKLGTVNLNLEELQKQERANMKNFLRSAKKKGTAMAIKSYLQSMDFEIKREIEANERRYLEVMTFNDIDHLDLDFDTDEDEEEELTDQQKIMMKKWIINPNGKFKVYWDHMQLVLILYTSIIFPTKLSYFDMGIYLIWDIIDYIIDFLFLIDLVINFFQPYYDKGNLVTDHCKIAMRYLKFWFWVDSLSIFPFELAFKQDSQLFIFLARVFKTPRIYRVFRMGRLIRTFKAGMKSDTIVVQYILHLIRSEKLLVSIAPIYFFGLVICHIFACIWHYNSDKSDDPKNWLTRYGYDSEPVHDRFWASLYYIYSTVTTTGYGDIGPDTNSEFVQTLVFMCCGVVFYSFVYSSIVAKFEDLAERNEEFHKKIVLLSELKRKKMFTGKKYLYREMLYLVDMFKEHGFEDDKIPKFFNVKPADRSKLLLQVCKRKYYFGKIDFFKTLPMYIWLNFFEHMSERVYSPGDLIYERGAVSDFFYVIAQGEICFMMNSEELKAYSFIQTSSYFGEIELFQESNRMWSVKAKGKLIVYALPKNDFFKLFTDPRIRRAFFEESLVRMKKFGKSQRECGRELRRVKRAQEKVKKFMAKNKASIHKSIRVSKRMGENEWHNHLEVVNEDYQNKILEKKRESDRKILIQKLEMGNFKAGSHREGLENLTKMLGANFGTKILLSQRRNDKPKPSRGNIRGNRDRNSKRQITSQSTHKKSAMKKPKKPSLEEKRGMLKRTVTFKDENE